MLEVTDGDFRGFGDISRELGTRGEQRQLGRSPTSRVGVRLCGGPILGTVQSESP